MGTSSSSGGLHHLRRILGSVLMGTTTGVVMGAVFGLLFATALGLLYGDLPGVLVLTLYFAGAGAISGTLVVLCGVALDRGEEDTEDLEEELTELEAVSLGEVGEHHDVTVSSTDDNGLVEVSSPAESRATLGTPHLKK